MRVFPDCRRRFKQKLRRASCDEAAGAMVSRVNLVPQTIALGALLAQVLPGAPGDARVVARTFLVMGTDVTFSAFTADPGAAERGFAAAYDEIQRVERLMTDWE